VVDELADDAEAATLGVLAQRPQLGLGVLAAVLGRDPGVEASSEVVVGSQCHVRVSKRVPLPSPEKRSVSASLVAPFQHIIKEFLCDRSAVWIAQALPSLIVGTGHATSCWQRGSWHAQAT